MKRVLTALFLVPVAVYSVLFAPWWIFTAVVALVAVLCFKEYAEITGSFAPLGYVAGLLILIAPSPLIFMIIMLSAVAAMCMPLAQDSLEQSVPRAASLALGILYVFGAWKAALLIRDVGPAGKHWLMFALMVNWIGDTGAYYVGRNFGRHKLAPSVSPGKTWEGAIASLATGMIFGMVYLPLAIPSVSLATAALVAVLGNAAGQLGDLAESAIKRGAGVKDSGTLLPGHGGLLDRMDSTIFTLPVIYSLLLALQKV